jgi:hypothetical protein
MVRHAMRFDARSSVYRLIRSICCSCTIWSTPQSGRSPWGQAWRVRGRDASAQSGCLDRFAFDSILLPYNYPMIGVPHYREDFEALLALCRERQVAVQTIKGVARRPRLDSNAAGFATWYEPLDQQAAVDTAVHWVLQRPDVFMNTVGDIQMLPLVLDAAARFQAGPTEEQMQRLALPQEIQPLFV